MTNAQSWRVKQGGGKHDSQNPHTHGGLQLSFGGMLFSRQTTGRPTRQKEHGKTGRCLILELEWTCTLFNMTGSESFAAIRVKDAVPRQRKPLKVNTSRTLLSSPGSASPSPLCHQHLLWSHCKPKGEEINEPQCPLIDARATRKQALPHSQTRVLQWGAAQQTSILVTIISFSSSEASCYSVLYASNPSLVPEMYQQNCARPDCGTDPDFKKKKKKIHPTHLIFPTHSRLGLLKQQPLSRGVQSTASDTSQIRQNLSQYEKSPCSNLINIQT